VLWLRQDLRYFRFDIPWNHTFGDYNPQK
jgi:hypothetical protein